MTSTTIVRFLEPPSYPAVCDFCGRFVAWKDAHLIHEFGDYGSILSTEIECPRCASKRKFWTDLERSL